MAYLLPHAGAEMWCMTGPPGDPEYEATRALRQTYRDEAATWLAVVREGIAWAAEHPQAVRAARRRRGAG